MQADAMPVDSRHSFKALEPMKKVQSQSEPRKRTISNDAVRRGFTTESMMMGSQHNVRERCYRHPKISNNHRFNRKMKAFNLSVKSIRSVNNRTDAQVEPEKERVFNERSEIFSLKKIRINSFVQNLTRIDSCNRNLAIAVKSNRLNDDYSPPKKVQRFIVRPTLNMLKDQPSNDETFRTQVELKKSIEANMRIIKNNKKLKIKLDMERGLFKVQKNDFK